VAFLAKELPKATLNPVGGSSKVVALTGTEAEQKQAKALLMTIDPQVAVTPVATPQLLERQTYQTNANAVDIAALVSTEFPGVVTSTLGKESSKILVVRAPSSVQGQVKSFLTQVDPVPVVVTGPVIIQRVFVLSNNTAEDAKKTLEGTLQRAASTDTNQGVLTTNPGSTSTTGSTAPIINVGTAATPSTGPTGTTTAAAVDSATASRSSVPPVTIIADPKSNSLIVRGTQEQINQVAELIPVIDKRLPRINVNVRVQEISETAARSLGIDWSAGIGNFVTKLITSGTGTGLTTLFDSTRSLAGLNIGATLNALENQGVSKRVDDSNLSLISGQITPTELNSGGTLTVKVGPTTVLTLPYGVIVRLIEPRVDNDGKITVTVDASVKNDPIVTDGGNTINIPNRQARTTISFQNGESVLLGGLLTSKDSTQSNGIPFLSSLPVVGGLFGTNTTKTERTQLLLIVTGTIIN